MPLLVMRFGNESGSADAWPSLEACDWRVEQAPLDASAAEVQRADCVVIDSAQPDAALIELCTTLALPPAHPPILVLLEHREIALAVELMKAGATDVLPRPVTGETLAARLHAALYERLLASGAIPQQARLTHREREVVVRALSGLTNKEIARQLAISPRTVEVHRRNAFLKISSLNPRGQREPVASSAPSAERPTPRPSA
jgi:FixJ family two-component response regulator